PILRVALELQERHPRALHDRYPHWATPPMTARDLKPHATLSAGFASAVTCRLLLPLGGFVKLPRGLRQNRYGRGVRDIVNSTWRSCIKTRRQDQLTTRGAVASWLLRRSDSILRSTSGVTSPVGYSPEKHAEQKLLSSGLPSRTASIRFSSVW